MRFFSPWITLISCRLSPTCYASLFSPRASLAVCFLLALFVAAGSEAVQQTQCAVVRYKRRGQANTVIVARYYRIVGGPGFPPVLTMFPFLSGMSSSSSAGTTTYWDSQYTSSNYPYCYQYVASYINGPDIPDDWSSDDLSSLVNNSYDSLRMDDRAAIHNFIASTVTSSDGTVSKSVDWLYRNVGTSIGGGVVVLDSTGTAYLAYPDSTGYVSGYTSDGLGGLSPIWYDFSSGSPVSVSADQTTDSTDLVYDSTTGLYTFRPPDYTPQLTSINRSIVELPERIKINPEVSLNPDITLNPEVTVNPTVTVTPDVTVSVTNPGSSLTVSDIAQGVRQGIATSPLSPESGTLQNDVKSLSKKVTTISTTLDDISSNFDDTSSSDLDLSASTLTQEEQSLLAVPQQWNTQIPLIGDAANVAFGAFLGNIPDPGRQLLPLNLEVLGFRMVIDFTPYSTYISWFRAFVLMLEFIWFLDCIWRSVVKVMSV